MKALYKKLFIAGIALISAGQLQAQKAVVRKSDYVINAKGDTVFSIISVPFIGKNSYTTVEGGTLNLDPTIIKEYFVRKKNATYRAVVRPGETKPVYLRALETGKINLYEDLDPSTMTTGNKATWYVTKGMGGLAELTATKLSPAKKGKAKNVFEQLIADNKEVYDSYLQDKKYSFDQIRSIIHLYNTGEWSQGWPKTEH